MQQVKNILPEGSIVGGRYRVEGLLGRGGFGAVYLVSDLRGSNNVYALKESIDIDQRERRHFAAEAEMLKRIDHRSLPRLYRVFDDPVQNRAYILMDYIKGSNLERLRRTRVHHRLSVNEALSMLEPVVEAIVYLHAQHPPIIHRDIKPANIILSESGTGAVLVDFGIAKEFDQDGTTSIVRHASPGYGAPEQYSAGTDMRTDVYGLGATLYTLLTGTLPPDAFFRLTSLASGKGDPLIATDQLLPEISPQVSRVITRSMALEQEARFASIEEFWQALRETALPVQVPAPVVSVPAASPLAFPALSSQPVEARSGQQGRSTRALAVIALCLALTLCLGLLFAVLLVQRVRQPSSGTAASSTSVQTAIITATVRPTATPSPTASPTATATLMPSPAPVSLTLVSNYHGLLDDIYGNTTVAMELSNVTQQEQNMQGDFSVEAPLSGNGPFTGSVNAAQRTLSFTVHSSDFQSPAPLYFWGQVQSDGALSGQYCSLNAANQCSQSAGGYGTWSAQPVQGQS